MVLFWLIAFLITIILALGGAFYLITRFHRFSFIQKLGEKHKALSWLSCLLPLGGIMCFGFINIYSVIVILIHLMVFWLIADIVFFIFRKTAKKERRKNIEGVCAMVFTAVYLSFGWYNAHHVRETDYTVTTAKELGADSIRIAAIADSHLSITLDGEDFAREMKRIESDDPDALVIVGDFVDDDTKKDDMLRACKALGDMKTKYGVYFVFGNHDKGYYEGYRDFSAAELRSELLKNNVVIIEDEAVLIGDSFYIIGRNDKSDEERLTAEKLTEGLDDSKYMLFLDHQPNDYDSEASAGADLVLSGHTHGGHIWPTGYIGLITKMNDRVYGSETRGNTDFIVSSGISGWAIPFKTGTYSEYLIIDIKRAA